RKLHCPLYRRQGGTLKRVVALNARRLGDRIMDLFSIQAPHVFPRIIRDITHIPICRDKWPITDMQWTSRLTPSRRADHIDWPGTSEQAHRAVPDLWVAVSRAAVADSLRPAVPGRRCSMAKRTPPP